MRWWNFSLKDVIGDRRYSRSTKTVSYKHPVQDQLTTCQFLQNLHPKIMRDFPYITSADQFEIVSCRAITGFNEFQAPAIVASSEPMTTLFMGQQGETFHLTFYIRIRPSSAPPAAAAAAVLEQEEEEKEEVTAGALCCILCRETDQPLNQYYTCIDSMTPHGICHTCFTMCSRNGIATCSVCRAARR